MKYQLDPFIVVFAKLQSGEGKMPDVDVHTLHQRGDSVRGGGVVVFVLVVVVVVKVKMIKKKGKREMPSDASSVSHY